MFRRVSRILVASFVAMVSLTVVSVNSSASVHSYWPFAIEKNPLVHDNAYVVVEPHGILVAYYGYRLNTQQIIEVHNVVGKFKNYYRICTLTVQDDMSCWLRLPSGPEYAGSATTNNGPVWITGAAVSPLIDYVVSRRLTPASFHVPYYFRLRVAGGHEPYIWRPLIALPDGLILNRSTGVISGTPLRKGNFSFRVQVTDIYGIVAGSLPLSLQVRN